MPSTVQTSIASSTPTHPGQAQRTHAQKGNVAAHHDDVAVGEVQHLGNAVDHRVAEGDDGVDAAKADTADKIGKKFHAVHLVLSVLTVNVLRHMPGRGVAPPPQDAADAPWLPGAPAARRNGSGEEGGRGRPSSFFTRRRRTRRPWMTTAMGSLLTVPSVPQVRPLPVRAVEAHGGELLD